MRFDLKDYEPVESRKKRFYEKYKDGRIIVIMMSLDEKHAIFKAVLYKNLEEQKEELPLATGFAQEIKGIGSPANKTSHAENCEQSAIGRALSNAGFSGNLNCSREEIEKVIRVEKEDKNALEKTNALGELSTVIAAKNYSPDQIKKLSYALFKKSTSKELELNEIRSLKGVLVSKEKENIMNMILKKKEKTDGKSDDGV